MRYQFSTTEEVEEFLRQVEAELIRIGVEQEEAIARINERFDGHEFMQINDPLLHRNPTFWAADIAYGQGALGTSDRAPVSEPRPAPRFWRAASANAAQPQSKSPKR